MPGLQKVLAVNYSVSASRGNHNKGETTVDAVSLLVVAGLVALGNALVLWQLNNVKTDLVNRIDGVKTDLGNRIDGVKTDLVNRIDGVKADLDAHEKECVERNREDAERDRRLHASIGGLIHAVEGRIPRPTA